MNRTQPNIPNTLPADPVLRCIEIIGGPGFGAQAATGRAVNASRSTVNSWRTHLPANWALPLREATVRAAKEKRIPVSEVPSLEALLEAGRRRA